MPRTLRTCSSAPSAACRSRDSWGLDQQLLVHDGGDDLSADPNRAGPGRSAAPRPAPCRLKISSSTCEGRHRPIRHHGRTGPPRRWCRRGGLPAAPERYPGSTRPPSHQARRALRPRPMGVHAAESVAVESTLVDPRYGRGRRRRRSAPPRSSPAPRAGAAGCAEEQGDRRGRCLDPAVVAHRSFLRPALPFGSPGAPLSACFGAVGAAPGIGGPPGAGRKAPLSLVTKKTASSPEPARAPARLRRRRPCTASSRAAASPARSAAGGGGPSP